MYWLYIPRDGLDEISLAAPTTVAELKDGEISEWTLTPDEVGIPSQTLTGLVVNSSRRKLKADQRCFRS